MFDALIFQQPNELVESQVGDFTSPEAFHTVYVQRFKNECIEVPTEVGSEFPVPVKALSADLAIQYRQFPDSTPPVVRSFFLARKTFVELAKDRQRLLQELRRLYLFTCRKLKYASFIPKSAPTLSPVVGRGSVEVSSVMIQIQ